MSRLAPTSSNYVTIAGTANAVLVHLNFAVVGVAVVVGGLETAIRTNPGSLIASVSPQCLSGFISELLCTHTFKKKRPVAFTRLSVHLHCFGKLASSSASCAPEAPLNAEGLARGGATAISSCRL